MSQPPNTELSEVVVILTVVGCMFSLSPPKSIDMGPFVTVGLCSLCTSMSEEFNIETSLLMLPRRFVDCDPVSS